MKQRLVFVAWLIGVTVVFSTLATAKIPWNLQTLSQPPKTYDVPSFATNGLRAVFFDGLPWKGKPTRVFAYIGVPDHKPGEKVPGIVLVHGGGGTAFAEWVKLWNSRGYAAIAMDTCGSIPGGGHGKRPRHEHSGPPGWGGFDQIDEPLEDQWTYHAVADVILAHSLLRSLPDVDANRIGLTGISWGGYLTCIVAGIDDRFRFAVPVYGCGYLGDNSTWLPQFKKMGAEKAAKWLGLWDPSRYLPRAKMPFLWVTGSNDFAYPLDSLQKSYRSISGTFTLCIRVRMPHGHGGPGEKPEEIRVFADHILKNGPPLAHITGPGTYESATPIVKAELNFTKDTGTWKERKWETIPATLVTNQFKFSAAIPVGATVYYFNLVDEHGLVVSTEHVVPRHEPLVLKTSGTPGKPVVFDGNGMVIDLGTDVTDHPWKKDGDLWTSNGPLLKREPVIAGQVAGLFIEEVPISIPRDVAAEKLQPERKSRCYFPPAALKPGQLGYAEDGSLYFRWPVGKTPGAARIILPAKPTVSCVSIACSNIIVRNITAKYAGNDGFNIHGKWTGIRIENVRAFSNGDEGISAHDDVEMAVNGAEIAWNGSFSGGVADVNQCVTSYRNCKIHDNFGAAFLFSGKSHTVTDTLIYNQTRDFTIEGGAEIKREHIEWRK